MPKNKKILLGLTIFFVAGTLIFAGGPKRRMPREGGNLPKPYADSEVLIKFKQGVNLASVNQFAATQSLIVKKQFGLLSKMKGQQLVLLKSIQKTDAEVLAKSLAKNSMVEYAHPNYFRQLAVTHPNDTYYNTPYQYLWGLHNVGQNSGTLDADIDAPEAWDISTGSSSIIVAVIDTGFDYSHPDLAANAWKNPGEIAGNSLDDDGNGYADDVYGIDPCGTVYADEIPDTDPMDGYGHGTHCAGTIGGRGNNSRGVVGVNWEVKIMGLKFFDDIGDGGADAHAIECIEYCVYQKTHGQNVAAINASWGSTGGLDSGALRDAIEIANNAGIAFCAAAGNGGSDNIGDNNETTHHYPSDYTLPGIISVAATDRNDARASFSNYGLVSVDLGAPGVSILSTVPGAYIPQSGDIFFDDMEGDMGQWTTGGTNNTWGFSTDLEWWENANFPLPSPPHFLTDSPGGDYLSGTNSWVRNANPINLSGYVGQPVYISFHAAFDICTGDHALVEISNDGGANWSTLLDRPYDGYYYYFSRVYGEIPDAFKTANFYIRFRLTTDGSNQWGGFGIDNVGIGTSLTYSYESWGGTSMATPHVAGAVAYLASIYPNETIAQRKERILDGGDPVDSMDGRTVSGNRLNLFGAYEHVPASGPSITVTSPNGGEVWMIGSAHNITWTTTGTVGNIEIHYSLDSGANWIAIDTNDPNDGNYSWTIPSVSPSTNCLVRVMERSDNDPSDTSDAVFSIVASTAETVSTPTTPTGPATGLVGATYTYTTGGSTSSMGHSVQYRFDWGDGTYSNWLPVGTTSASHSWLAAATYNVRAMARCSIHYVQSDWSAALPVTLDETPTWAAFTRFAASDGEGLPAVEWHTASELGTVGFNLFRQDSRTGEFQLVNADLLPALPASPQGGVYRFVDPGAYFNEPMTYRLDEIDSQGRGRSYGPFTITFGDFAQPDALDPALRMGKEEESDVVGYRRYPRQGSLLDEERLEARRREQQAGSLQAAAANGRARITVKGRGLFYVTAAQIANSLGIPQSGAMALIGNRNLKLTGLGREIAWLADANSAGLFFYNEGKETLYSDKNVYFLEKGRGLPMQAVSGGSAGVAGAQSFMDTLHFEGNRYPLLIAAMDPAGDVWFWDYVVGGSAAKTFAVDVPSAASGRATLKVSLRGATDTTASHDHHARVSVNGREIGDAAWGGAKAHEFEIEFESSLLQEGGNVISVSGALDTGAPHSIFYVQSFDLSYPRYYQAMNNSLVCRGDGHSAITVSGLTELQAVVLDVTAADRPEQLAGVTVDVSGRVTFAPRNATNAYLISGLNAAQRPLAVVGDLPAKIRGVSQSADHVVIAPEEFKATARQLVDYRNKRGLKSVLVTLEDIYEVFSHGVPTPYAIRDFLAFARKKWTGRKVKYAVLAGKGTYDYNDYQGHGDNLVPAVLGRTPEGLCAADRIYGDVVGRDGLPEIAIGRLPAVTNAELKAMINKIKAYERGQGAWLDKALMIADNGDSGGDFAAGCNELAGLAVGMQAEKIYLAGAAAEARDKIIASWNAGAGLVNYCGHAGIDQLATENIFNAANAGALQNDGMLPLVTMYTCAAGRFELPGFTSLGEALLLNARGGMAGGMLPSGAAYHSDSMRLGEQFYKAVYQAKAARAGEAWLAALKNYLLLGGNSSLLNVYNWLGDPGMLLK